MDALKHCHQCGLDKPRSAFTPRKQSWDGLRSECRECRNRRQAKDYQRNLEENRTYNREYMKKRREADPKKYNDIMANWRAANPIKVKEAEKRHYQKHRIKRLKKSAKWSKENPKRRRELAKRWRLENPEKWKATVKRTVAKNRAAVNQRNRNRRALKAAAPGRHSAKDVAELMIKQKVKCASDWCRADIREKYTVDHIIALARGGSNDRKNIQLLCPTCNTQKHAKHPIDFAQENGMLL